MQGIEGVRFKRLIMDESASDRSPHPPEDASKKRLIFCTGKVQPQAPHHSREAGSPNSHALQAQAVTTVAATSVLFAFILGGRAHLSLAYLRLSKPACRSSSCALSYYLTWHQPAGCNKIITH